MQEQDTPRFERYRMTLAYDGTAFHGWQKQRTAEGVWLRTVQGVVEEAVCRTVAQPVQVVGASRTDAGVHALGQVAQFDAATRIPTERLSEAINSRLPHDVEVREVAVADHHFEAISGARSKQYRYRIFNARRRPLQHRHYVYHCWWPLDVGQMNEAAARLVGEHDFTSFAGAGSPRVTNVRTIFACYAERHVDAHVDADEVHIVVSGSGFLYNMVRIIAGTLVDAGRGAVNADDVAEALAARDRRMAGPTLPPEGLWLEWIKYE